MRNFRVNYLILLTVLILFITSCEKSYVEDINKKEKEAFFQNETPHCSITGIDEGDTIVKGLDVQINLEANDGDGRIDSVQLFINKERILANTMTNQDYVWKTRKYDTGEYEFKLLVTDNDGKDTLISRNLILSAPKPVKDYDGNLYKTVHIGNQTWMAENLKTTHYSDGSLIPKITNNVDWKNLKSSGMCWTDKAKYGILYNRFAVVNGQKSSNSNPSNVQGVCPTGWHVPSDNEWRELMQYLYSQGFNNKEGLVLKSKTGWTTNGIDEFGFNVVPVGVRTSGDGEFYKIGERTEFWTCTETPFDEWLGGIFYNSKRFDNNNSYSLFAGSPQSGHSVRCVKD